MLLQGGRPVARLPLNLQCLAIGHTGFSSSNVQRVASLYNNSQLQSLFCPALQDRSTKPASCRTYATKPVSRPKAHTGRTTTAARKAPTTSKTKAAKKPAPKTTAPKAIPRAKPKAKPRIKAKPKRAKTAKAKPKPRTKKVLTEDQKKTATIRDLRAAALKAPTGSASTAWAVFSQERIKQTNSGGLAALGPAMKEASPAFKNLSPERLEHYNHIANQNKAASEKAYRQWIESHSPLVIHAANIARRKLNKSTKGYKKPLHDTRLVKFPIGSFTQFYTERCSTGDFKGLKANEAAKLAGREWKALSANEKKPYEDAAKADMARYTQEKKTVYNQDVRPRAKAAPAA